jgi:urease accessory protein
VTSAKEADGQAFLTALQLADGTFPSGRYTLSQGLESFIQLQRLQGPEDLRKLLEDYVTLVVGPTDAVATASAVRAVEGDDLATLVDADLLLLSLKLAHESAMASRRTGHSLLRLACDLTENRTLDSYATEVSSGRAPGNYAVVFGILAAALGLTADQAATVELYSFVAGLLGVALRIFGIDHTFAQQTLQELRPVLRQAAGLATSTHYQDMGAFAPLIDIMQMRHERAHIRLFGS